MKMARPAFVVLLAVPVFWISGLSGSRAIGDPGGTLDRLSFLSGCWEGTFQAERGSGIIEEHYTSPSDNLILGTTRYILEGRTVMWEFSKIEESDGSVVLTPFPRGQPSEHPFEMTSLEENEVLFEAPEHDFPRRIVYRRDDEMLTARIDDGTDRLVDEWEMRPAPCG